ncbi:hypothetical protein GM661_00350 [Iocasia frigidifontis]|uniref:Uncharacterized protein n=1 Tax=Iocasia fonsfrigidae TaxID=2682810 RepID=A0A8A7KEB7_9FIRM|nr:hypothetical protein [Iocasia fonsfrigidae]QTL96524.1 hypothetical protein GM661_00350 [Iocasia fonsfrigidae]
MSKDSKDWIDISYYLYSGINQEIDFHKRNPTTISEAGIENLKKAVAIYLEHCTLSGKHLEENLESLIEKEGEIDGSNGTDFATIEGND